jgi:hypothetical protein
MHFFQSCSTPFIDELTIYVHQKWHLHPNWCCYYRPNVSKFISPILCNPKICYFQCGSSQRKKLSRSTPTNQFFLLAIEVFYVYVNKFMCFYMIVPMPFGAWKNQKAFIFLSLLLFYHQKISITLQRYKHIPS